MKLNQDWSNHQTLITVPSHEHHGISNEWLLDCLSNNLFRLTSKDTSKLSSLAFCEAKPRVKRAILMHSEYIFSVKPFSSLNYHIVWVRSRPLCLHEPHIANMEISRKCSVVDWWISCESKQTICKMACFMAVICWVHNSYPIILFKSFQFLLDNRMSLAEITGTQSSNELKWCAKLERISVW